MKHIPLFIMILSATLFSQNVEILEGDYSNLKGISAYNLIFDYSNIKVPDYDTEKEFLNYKVQEYNSIESGKGEKFKKDWYSDREKYYEPEFIERFNYYLKKANIKVGKNLDNVDYTNLKAVDYVMKIHTIKIYTEYSNDENIANSKITVNISIYNSNEPDNILLKVRYNEINSGAYKNVNQDTKVFKSYGQLGKLVAVGIRKNLNKL